MSENRLDLSLLVDSAQPPLERLRIGLEDALKEYAEFDLLVELLQNSLDAVDQIRYTAICEAAGVSPGERSTVEKWNAAVEDAIKADFDEYHAATDTVSLAAWHGTALDDARRRRAWWERLSQALGGSAESLAAAASAHRGSLLVDVVTGASCWITVEDNGTGMQDPLTAFQLASSDKRKRPSMPRRHGLRGAHGWGLTAVLGLSDRVEVATRTNDGERAYVFENFASFARGLVAEPTIVEVDFGSVADVGSSLKAGGRGTLVRVRIADPADTNLLGYALRQPTMGRLVNLLRLYTPVGQVNDYLAHPAYHSSRAGDLDVKLRWTHDTAAAVEESVPFRFLEVSELRNAPSLDFKSYVNSSMPSRRTVHTLFRASRGGQYFLSAADVQPADIWKELEADLYEAESLPGLIGDNGDFMGEIPRGFQVAVSGGMRTEFRAREPKGTSAAFRGVLIQENQEPTLGRRTVLDQRKSMPKVASDHESAYEDVRKKLVGKAEPLPQTLASAKWRLEYFQSIRTSLRHAPPQSDELQVWAGNDSGEARVMLAFAELLGRGSFGDLRIIRCGLAHGYDFAFIQYLETGDIDPETQRKLIEAGYSAAMPDPKRVSRYGLGEFKDIGETVLGEFDESIRQKQADSIDLLICQSFDEEAVSGAGWTSNRVEDSTREFIGQTHVWTPNMGYAHRQRAMAVVSLSDLLPELVSSGDLTPFSGEWDQLLPPLFNG